MGHFTEDKYNLNVFTSSALELAYFIACCVNHLCLCCLLSESLKIFFSQVFKN